MTNYPKIRPITHPIPAERQAARRHYGVHPYFTRRPFNVVRRYILNYSRERDVVLDPFGGSGVTAIEAFLENRVGIQNDINPLANFIAEGIANLSSGELADYKEALSFLQRNCRDRLTEIENAEPESLNKFKRSLPLPPNVPLPRNADVEKFHDLFTDAQLIGLSLLKECIGQVVEKSARSAMVLAWSATLTKLNKTFLSAEGRAASRGGSSIFSIYRYKVAKHPVVLPLWLTFEERAKNVVAAKAEIDALIDLKRRTSGWLGEFRVSSLDVEALSTDFKDSVDYIFTDPPYGAHISYLDLSTLWNNWLGLGVSVDQRDRELIVGGDLDHSEAWYTERLRKSIDACLRMLKPGRWLSVVFQHWNTAYFEAILSSAAESGADLKAAISQVGDPIWSMHKKKGSESVLAGEMILTFLKTGRRKSIQQKNTYDVSAALRKVLSDAPRDRVYGEFLFNQLIIDAWNRSAIGSLDITKEYFADLMRQQGWRYDLRSHYWIRAGVSEPTLFTLT